MKLVTFQIDGNVHHGVLHGEPDQGSIVDLGPGDLLALVESGGLGVERAAAEISTPPYDVSAVRLMAPLLRPPKLLALARNYQDHITEGGGQPVDTQRIVPKLFLKPSSAIVGPDQ